MYDLRPPNNLEHMICSVCGRLISVALLGIHDIFDCGWECSHCKMYWLSSDGWKLVDNLLVPFR